jgi:thiosulfate/3-mercaptopyruvate sulfurtransferase
MCEPLVSTAWLAQHLSDPDVLVLEVDEEAARYYEGHVPGAAPVDWLDDLHPPLRRGVVPPEQLAALLSDLGADPDTHLVLVGDAQSTYAASAYWLLRYYGHRRLSLLDGGKAAWVAEGRPLEVEIDFRPPTTYPVPRPDPSVRVRREEVLADFVGAPDGRVVLDCRTSREYGGHEARGVDLPVEHHRVPGHVPGARNLESGEVLDPVTDRFLPVEELRSRFAARGVASDVAVVLYCRLAERSALLWFALHELLGHRDARLYDGGWAEYGSLVDAPVELAPSR